ncbi:MAG: UDP-N-acetylmuramoyl-L-alanyl-D-glutamate--2,6-diaminopimelate ligase [Lachnospiraceae bacterium]|nr:UDP-N-acetylmuramoyl-L-alanyl-D-glutamate--2,6-diaminopimelate ligase [Lachnospiraceae bacterium]
MIATKLLERLEYDYICGDMNKEVTGIATDNRRANAGCAFICIKGARFDTHSCVEQVADAGASLVVVSREWAGEHQDIIDGTEGAAIVSVEDTRLAKALIYCAYYGYPADRLVTVGITGSKGKTTTAHMIADSLRAAGFKTGTIGTNGAVIGDKSYDLANTTPDSDEMQKYLAMMVGEGITHAVIECSSQGLMQHRQGGIVFDVAVFTNISTGDHVGPNEHASFDDYLRCKSLLFKTCRRAVVNADDPNILRILEGCTAPVLTYGEEGHEHVLKPDILVKNCAKTYENDTPGLTFTCEGMVSGDFSVNLPGEFNIMNAAAAIATIASLGVDLKYAKTAISNMHIKGRIDMIYRSPELSVCVDFAHNGQSTESLLKALREYRPKRLICVFGADGNRAISRRLLMGEMSGRYADLSIVTSGHNRYETFEQILVDTEKGLKAGGGKYIAIKDRKEAIRYAIENRKPGDLITIIGLGHENYQEENGVKHPYSDTEYTLSVLREHGLVK